MHFLCQFLGDADVNFATLPDQKELASHILVFMIRSIVNPLSFSFATFATTGATSYQIFPLFWKAVAILEDMGLKVISCTADGASSNRKFFKMHKLLCSEDVVFYSLNIFAKEESRYIYFFSDAPHLLKTARNCLSNSGANKNSRLMWNKGFFLLWSHISRMYYEDLSCPLKFLPRLTSDHINLTGTSIMRVRLAAQVLSSTVSSVLKSFGPPEAAETAKFCMMMDSFFDCFNVRNTTEHERKRKNFLAPYNSVNDERFSWLDQFLQYLDEWKDSIEGHPGNYSPADNAKMFISHQTYIGLQISVKSLQRVIPYLLNSGVDYVLSEKFCQDDLENYFGRQRAIGRNMDNPNLRQTGYNDNVIKSQMVVRPIAGNVRSKAENWNVIDDEPLPKRHKK